jgi:hypothetical protein
MKGQPAKAQYLLRFDDLCPTMDRVRWKGFAALIARFEVRPILAVVPDNRDPDLKRDDEDEGFWEEMRALDGSGATIGLHGFQHLCSSQGRSLIPIHHRTEFAGAAEELQREWIGAGLAILRERKLRPRIWVAPRHGFDRGTLRVLLKERIDLISDGFAEQPFRRFGMVWVPQQLWAPVQKQSGLWTICLHPNTAEEHMIADLEEFLARFASQFTSVDRVLAESTIYERSWDDRLFHARMVTRIKLAQMKRRLNSA